MIWWSSTLLLQSPLLCSALVRHISLLGDFSANDFGRGVSAFEEWGFVCCTSFPSGSFFLVHVFISTGSVVLKVVIQEQPVLLLWVTIVKLHLWQACCYMLGLDTKLAVLYGIFKNSQKQLRNKCKFMKTLLWRWIFSFLASLCFGKPQTYVVLLWWYSLSPSLLWCIRTQNMFGTLFLREF